MGACLFVAPAALGAQYLQGGDFEGGTELPPLSEGAIDHPSWVEEDDIFPSPICSAKCPSDAGSAGPRSGTQWAWFGAATELAQNQNLRQDVTFPATPVAVALSFYVRVGKFENESAVLRAKLDGVTLFTLDAQNQADYASGYTRVVVPFEDPVQGGPYEVLFEYESGAGAVNERTNVNVDDVSVETTYLRDGDFEAAEPKTDPLTAREYFDSPGWTEAADDGFQSPICESVACGSGLPEDIREPHGGLHWFYFGFARNASVAQTLSTPALANATLSFFVLANEFVNPGARLSVKVDGAARFTVDPSNDQLFADRYRAMALSLGPLAAGNHSVAIAYALPEGGPAGANVDDLALTGTIAPPPGPGGPPAGPAAQPPVGPAPVPNPPQTRIVKLKPLSGKTKRGAPRLGAQLSFAGSGGSGKLRFQCKLDQGKFRPCTSPKTYRSLKPGGHSFQVRAVDSAGAADPSPAKRSFQIAAPRPRGAR